MRAMYRALAAAAGISILAACSSGQSAIEPPFTAVNVQNTSSLQFRVGTANYQGTTFLNTVVTFRQPDGLSAVLFSTPTITGPAGFVVPAAGSAGTDGLTAHISGTPPTQPGTPAVATTFGQSGGAFAYGFAPANSTTAGTANYTHTSTSSTLIAGVSVTNSYTQPIYLATAAKLPFILGPPAVPDFHPLASGFPVGFAGYDSGFVMFGATPVAGTYSFNLTVPSNIIGQNSAVFNTTATLASLAVLPTPVAPVIGGGAGAAFTFTVPAAAAGATSRVIYITDRAGVNNTIGNEFFAINAGTAAGTFTLAASNFATGDRISAYTVTADFDIVGGAPPANLNPTPALPAQTDVAVGPVAGPVTF